MSDDVNKPVHYTAGGVEVIDFIRSVLTPEEFKGYCKGNILKYICRERFKGKAVDLRKAAVYLRWAIEREEDGQRDRDSTGEVQSNSAVPDQKGDGRFKAAL